METRGVVRRLDELGRIVIPIEFRKMLGVERNSNMEITMTTDKKLIIQAIEEYTPVHCQVCNKIVAQVAGDVEIICADVKCKTC